MKYYMNSKAVRLAFRHKETTCFVIATALLSKMSCSAISLKKQEKIKTEVLIPGFSKKVSQFLILRNHACRPFFSLD